MHTSGMSAPKVKAIIDAQAACQGLVRSLGSIPNSTSACAPRASWAVSSRATSTASSSAQPFGHVEVGEFRQFFFGLLDKLAAFLVRQCTFGVTLGADRDVFACGHAHRPGDEAGNSGHGDRRSARCRTGHAENDAGRRHDAVVGPENPRSQPVQAAADAAAVRLVVVRPDVLVWLRERFGHAPIFAMEAYVGKQGMPSLPTPPAPKPDSPPLKSPFLPRNSDFKVGLSGFRSRVRGRSVPS